MGQVATELREEQCHAVEGRGSGTWQSPQCMRKGAVRECAPRVRAEWAMWRELRRKRGRRFRYSFLCVFSGSFEHRCQSEMVRTLF